MGPGGLKKQFKRPTSIIYVMAHAIIFLVGVVLVLADPCSTVFVSVGTSLVAAGISGWVVFVYVLISDQSARQLRSLQAAGMNAAFPARSISIRDEYDRRVAGARDSVDVIGYGLSSFRQDHLRDFPRWKAQVRMRILLIDPEFPSPALSYAAQRDVEEGNPVGTIAEHVKRFVADTRPILEDGRFEVRLYRCLPLMNIFRFDDEILWGPYLMKEQSRNAPTFLAQRGGFVFERLADHFERIWNDPELCRTPPANW